MSSKAEVLLHPINGVSVETWEGFSWPAFFFGIFWMLAKGLYAHFLICLLIVIATSGIAAPFIWIAYGFIGNEQYKASLLKKGYLTKVQWSYRTERTPETKNDTPVPNARDSVTQLRELAELRERGVLTDEEFVSQKNKLLTQ